MTQHVTASTRRAAFSLLAAASLLGLAACGPSTPEDVAKSYVTKLYLDGDLKGALKMTDMSDEEREEMVKQNESQDIRMKECSIKDAENEGDDKGTVSVRVTLSCEGDGNLGKTFKVRDGKILKQTAF